MDLLVGSLYMGGEILEKPFSSNVSLKIGFVSLCTRER